MTDLHLIPSALLARIEEALSAHGEASILEELLSLRAAQQARLSLVVSRPQVKHLADFSAGLPSERDVVVLQIKPNKAGQPALFAGVPGAGPSSVVELLSD